MKLTGKTIVITGSNRGIGKELLLAALKENPEKIYATARDTSKIETNDPRVHKINLDLNDPESIKKMSTFQNIDVLINNAGALAYDNISFDKDLNMSTNYYGTLALTDTLIPNMNNGGIIANVCSILALTPMAFTKKYSASKAALHSATQSYRMQLKKENIHVLGIYPATIDTDMAKDFGDMQKADPITTAQNILKGIEEGIEYIFPDNGSNYVGNEFMKNPASLEKMFAQ
ncbi:short-chain dehydrogenase [Sphingobacteriaceae bacterium]|nr:short-chain dehydrogenase [Sphingobacteriaceae bacterium]